MTSIEQVPLKSALGISTLLSVADIGPVTVKKVLGRFDTFSEVLSASAEDLKPVMNEKQRRRLQDEPAALAEAYTFAQRQVERAAEYEIDMLSVYDEGYPSRLRDDPSPPMVIFIGGDVSQLEASVACIGTREASQWGKDVSYSMTRAMADEGWRIVSGLANGVDAQCHKAALDARVPTAAVLACGVDMIDPDRDRSRFEFLDRILGEGGLVVTEQLFGTPPSENTYIRRNRLITGLSVATFFMQGEMSGGSMHSVKYAIQQGRPIYVPAISPVRGQDPLNHAASNLGRLSPQEMVMLMDLQKGNLKDALEGMTAATVANAVYGSQDYPRVMRELEDHLSQSYRAPMLAMAG